MKKWDLPPKIKIYEALGSLGDGRLEVINNSGKLYSSSKNKFYQIEFDPNLNAIMCNDNASYYVGYLGYPAIAFLIKIGVINHNTKWEEALKDIKWKDINQSFKNDFSKTEDYTLNLISEKGFIKEDFLREVESIYCQIKELDIGILGKKIKPPLGY